MALRCFKYATPAEIGKCDLRKVDGHCFHCIYCREDESEEDFVPASDETKYQVLKKFIDFFDIKENK